MMKKIKILTVFGTRPEVIKLAPFIKEVEKDPECISVTCATTQHRELQNDILKLFKVRADYNLEVMKEGQDLFYITEKILQAIHLVLDREKPDYIVVQGDTTTAFSAALAGFYRQIPVVHVEAGLRTGDIYSPFPEEANRSLISRIATFHMAPTQKAVDNLANEGIFKNVFKVGNSIVDSVDWAIKNCVPHNILIKEKINSSKKNILITVHRRENFDEPLIKICAAIQELCELYFDYTFIWPVHPNPNVGKVVYNNLQNIKNLHLTAPLSYSDLVLLINSCSLILSDSGGIQEEACILGKKIIILREDTERPEVVEEGYGVLVGSDREKICACFKQFIQDNQTFTKKNLSNKIYGAPGVSKNILSRIKGSIGIKNVSS